MRKRSFGIAMAMVVALLPTTVGAGGGKPPVYTPGSAGVGDPYFPSDGNGGYDVDHYALVIKYDPATGVLDGKATITAEATQNLSAFNLDFLGLDIASIRVNGTLATYSRDGDELTVTPNRGLRRHDKFTTVVRYSGVPQLIDDPALGLNGFFATDDGAMIVGEPHVASTWFPVNDHPSDAASYSFEVTVPKGGRGDRQRRPQWQAHLARMDDMVVGRQGPDGVLPRNRRDRPVRDHQLSRSRSADRRRHRPRPVHTTGQPVRRRGAARVDPVEFQLQAFAARRQRAAGGWTAHVLDRSRDRTLVGLLLRRGPHGRRRRLDDAARGVRDHVRRHRQLLPVLAHDPPLPHPLPDRQRRRHVQPHRFVRDMERSQRHRFGVDTVDDRSECVRR